MTAALLDLGPRVDAPAGTASTAARADSGSAFGEVMGHVMGDAAPRPRDDDRATARDRDLRAGRHEDHTDAPDRDQDAAALLGPVTAQYSQPAQQPVAQDSPHRHPGSRQTAQAPHGIGSPHAPAAAHDRVSHGTAHEAAARTGTDGTGTDGTDRRLAGAHRHATDPTDEAGRTGRSAGHLPGRLTGQAGSGGTEDAGRTGHAPRQPAPSDPRNSFASTSASTTAAQSATAPVAPPAAVEQTATVRPHPAEHLIEHRAPQDGASRGVPAGTSYPMTTTRTAQPGATDPTSHAQPQQVPTPQVPVVAVPTATATVINSTPVATTTPTAPPVPLAQPDIAGMLAQLRGGPDGSYQLRAQVHPAELGSVAITATVAGGTLTVLLSADHQAHGALSAALPQLRAHLADQGFTGVDVGLGSPDQDTGQAGDQAGGRHTQGSDHARETDQQIVTDEIAADHRRTTPTGAIDRLL